MTEEPIRERELAEELGIGPYELKKFRKNHLSRDDWFTRQGEKGGRPAIWLTYEGQRKMRIYAEAKDDAPQVIQSFIWAKVLGPAPHPARVWISVPDGEGELVKRPCVVPLRLKGMLTRGKRIRVEVVSDRDGNSYRHEKLAGFPTSS